MTQPTPPDPAAAAGPTALALTALTWVAAAVIGAVLVRRRVLHPRAFDLNEPRTSRDLGGVPALVWFAAAVTILGAQIVLSGVAAALPESVTGAAGSLRERTIEEGLVYAGCAALGLLLAGRLAAAAGPSAGLRLAGRDVWRGALGFAAVFPFCLVAGQVGIEVRELVSGAPVPPIAHTSLEALLAGRGEAWFGPKLAVLLIGPPVVEELVFRVFLQSAWLGALGGGVRTFGAIGATSVIFALLHVGLVPWHALPTLLVLSVGLGIVYERAGARGGGPVAAMTSHALFNAANVAMAAALVRA